jgi:hypothetical protein
VGGGGSRQPGPAQAHGGPVGGERLPMATRERKPALAALAVLLILVGALGATVMVMRAGNKISVVEIVDSVAIGQPIPATAIHEVMISDISGDSNVDLIRWGQRDDLVKHWLAKTNLVPNSLLTQSMITTKDEVLTPGKSIVGLTLKEGQFPSDLSIGDTVAAYKVGNDAAKAEAGGGSDSTGGAGTPINGHLVVKTKVATSGSTGGGDVSVTVVVDTADAAALTIAASADEVSLVRVPSSG